MKKLGDLVKQKDGIAVGIHESMHFNGDDRYKTVAGGTISILIYAFMMYYTGMNAYKMTIHQNPYIVSVGRAIDYQNDDVATARVPLNESTKVFYEVYDHQWNMYNHEQSKKYITITYNQVSKLVDKNGEIIFQKD